MRRIFLLAAVLSLVPLAAVASHGFSDVPDTNVFHADIDWLKNSGVTLGCNPNDDPPNTLFCPQDPVTREQMAAFLHRLALNQVVDAGFLGGVPAADYLERADSAAVAQSIPPGTALTGGIQSVGSVTITAPAAGYVLVMGSAELFMPHTTGTETTVRVGVSDSATGFPGGLGGPQDKAVTIDAGVATGDFRQGTASQHIFPVTAGSHTFHLLGEPVSGGVINVNDQVLSAVFFPLAAGTVESPVAGLDTSGDG